MVFDGKTMLVQPDAELPKVLQQIPIALGVIGHRKLRDEDRPELRNALKQIFLEFRTAFSSAPLMLLSSLAEGADQLAVEATDELNAEQNAGILLRAPLPFPAELYAESSSFGFEPDKTQPESGKHAVEFMRNRVARLGNQAFVVPFDSGPVEDLERWKHLAEVIILPLSLSAS